MDNGLMQVIIRLDDITPEMDLKKFNIVRNILDDYNIKPLIGVVPDCRDHTLGYDTTNSGFWELIHELAESGWTIAQHGTYHLYETEDSGILGINQFSEFAGLPYDTQLDKLRIGRDILLSHGIHTDIFMAPGHTFDTNTIWALRELGFSTITDGLYSQCYEYEGIVCVPCRLSSYNKVSGIDTICIHTNLMKENDIFELKDFIVHNHDSIIPFDTQELYSMAIPCTPVVRKEEARMLAKRIKRGKIAKNAKLSWYLNYTYHKNSQIKWLRRIIMLPMLILKR